MERKMAISLVFSMTIIANTLNIPSPERRRILETVIADEILSTLKTSSHTFSRSCQLIVRCPTVS